MNTAASTAETETLFNCLLGSISGLSSDRVAIWDATDHRKGMFFFGFEVCPSDPLGFVINNERMMIAFMVNQAEQKFYLRFYWLGFEFAPGFISDALSQEEAEVIITGFTQSQLIFTAAKAEELRLRKISGKPETFVRDNAKHREIMAEIFNVANFAEHVKSLK
jgi:hypothetical protein